MLLPVEYVQVVEKRKYETKNKDFESFVETIGGEPSVQNVTIIEHKS